MANQQREWSEAPEIAPGVRVRKLLPDIKARRPHGQITYYLAQVIKAHKNLQLYLNRFNIAPSCVHCAGGEQDDVEHTLLRY